MNWKKYEKEILELIKEQYPAAPIRHNVKLDGVYSKTKRQVDIIIEERIAGHNIRIVFDAKHYSKRVNVKTVESFIGMLSDLGAHKGLIITEKGYSKAALNRAFNDPMDIELDILNFDELKSYQGFGAIVHVGNHGVIFPTPFGWIVDGMKKPDILASLYQRGMTWNQAVQAGQWMYLTIWDRLKDNDDLESLFKIQEGRIRGHNPKTKISYLETVQIENVRTKLRLCVFEEVNYMEYTGFVEFQDFIFIVVLFTTEPMRKTNLRKLEYLLTKAQPLKVKLDKK